MLKKIKEFLCIHKWKIVYIYGLSADYKCSRCGKYKKDFIV